jgi:serine protease Do
MRICIVFLAAWIVPLPVEGQGAANLRSFSQAVRELSERVRPSVVQVRTSSGVGAGIIVDSQGYILTNAHVIGNAKRVEVVTARPARELAEFQSAIKPPGKMFVAEVVGTDVEADIAVLKTPAVALPSLRFADYEKLKQGDLVIAVGSPLGLENSMTMGVVSSVARQLRADDPMIYIQTDASINPGNSGGPLVDADGLVIGINTLIASQSGGSEGIGFAVPSHIVQTIYEQIRKHGRMRRGYIGVILQTITPALAEALHLEKDWGGIIADVAPGGSAAAAGLEIKDVILNLDGKAVENARQFGVNIYRRAGETVTLELLRAGKKVTKQVAVLERPQDPQRLASLVQGEANRVAKFGLFGIDLDEKVTPMLPPMRRLSGVVVLVAAADTFLPGDVIYEVNGTKIDNLDGLKAVAGALASGQAVAVHLERLGQLQFVTFRSE